MSDLEMKLNQLSESPEDQVRHGRLVQTDEPTRTESFDVDMDPPGAIVDPPR
jgi:hypothetical protein